jgi:hypothetical protein
MKPLIIIVAFIIQIGIGYDCQAQQTYYYGYDSTGNRTSRSITLANTLKSATTGIDKEEMKIEEKIDNLEITIYPNPTNSQITIDIQGLDEEQPSIISLYDFSGRLLKNIKDIQESNIVELSELPNATYILKIIIGDKKSEWKIIKQ